MRSLIAEYKILTKGKRCMALSVIAGTAFGTRLLTKINDERFTQLYKLTLTLVAFRLIWSGVAALY